MKKFALLFTPNSIVYFVSCILLMIVGVIITNLWLMNPFDLDTLIKIASLISSLVTIWALAVAVRSLSTWKLQHVITKADLLFDEILKSFHESSGKFNEYYNAERDLSKKQVNSTGYSTPTSEEEIRQLTSERDAFQSDWEDSVQFHKKLLAQLNRQIAGLTNYEVVVLNHIDINWRQAIKLITFDSFEDNSTLAIQERESKSFQLVMENYKEQTSILMKVKKELSLKLTP